MQIGHYLTRLYAYHNWRVGILAEHLKGLDNAVLSHPAPGSFGSLRELIGHLVGAELIWQARHEGKSLTAPPAFTTDSFEALGTYWQAVVKRWQPHLTSAIERPEQPLGYTNLSGTRYETPRAEVFIHVIDHATYHIGQLVAALRALEQPVVSVSFIQYVRQSGA